MSFRPMLRPGQGFQPLTVYRREGGVTAKGRPTTEKLVLRGKFFGIISQASPREQEQFKQLGTPVTHTIVQRGTRCQADATDVLETADGRMFLVKGKPHDPGELHHFLVYRVEERTDLKRAKTGDEA